MERECVSDGTFIYFVPCHRDTGKVEAMTTRKRQTAIALTLLMASLVALSPAISLEKPLQAPGTIYITANGQAFTKGSAKCTGTGSSVTLTLTGPMQTEGKNEIKLKNLSGSLTIGSTNYAISDGKGEVNKKGKLEINGKTSNGDRKLELILHGTMNDDKIAFDCSQSKLSSLFFLSLTGQATFAADTTSSGTTQSQGQTATVTVIENRTITETTTENHTITETATETITETMTQTGTNSTVTVTETLTTTVANSTLTITTTVTNSTQTATQT